MLKKQLRHLVGQLEKRTSCRATHVVYIQFWRQWQPLVFPPIQASDGALRSVKHERPKVVIWVRGCRMTKNSGIALQDTDTRRPFE